MLLRILVVVLICSNFLFSQNKELIKQLTNTVINENDNDSIKTTKIYKWIIDNIEYNTKIFKTQKLQSIEEILDKKSASNEGYSNLFSKMLDYAKIKNSQVTGYYKGLFYENNDLFLRENHIWNAVNVNSNWYLFDLTLASGYLQNINSTNTNLQKIKWVKGFNKDMVFADPYYLIKTHLPLQKYWQLTDYPIKITEFEKNKYSNKRTESYNYTKAIDANYYKTKNLKHEFKNTDIAFKENNNNFSIIGKKYNKLAIKAFEPIKNRSVASEDEYKKIISQVNKLNKQASLQFSSHIRNVKKEFKKKQVKNKYFSTNNSKQITDNIKNLNKDKLNRDKAIDQLNKKNNIFSLLIETYEKSKINDQNKVIGTREDINNIEKLKSEFKELKKLQYLIKQINTDTIKYKIESINILEDSVNKMLSIKYGYEKQKTNFIKKFSFNQLSNYYSINDSLKIYSKLIYSLLNEFKNNVDTSYFNIEDRIKMLVKQAEIHYKKAKTVIVSKKMENSIFSLFNNTIDSIYNNAQLVLKANISSFKPMIKHLSKEYYNLTKDILSETENQQKAETDRYNNFTEYYNRLMNNEIEIFNSAIEKCNKRITKSYDDYKKEGVEPIKEVKFIFIE